MTLKHTEDNERRKTMIAIAIFLLVFVVWPVCAAQRAARRREERARREQEYLERTIANGILRGEAVKGEILANALARAAEEQSKRNEQLEQYWQDQRRAEMLAKLDRDADFDRLMKR